MSDAKNTNIAIKSNQYDVFEKLVNNGTELYPNSFMELIRQNNSVSLYFTHKILDKKLLNIDYYSIRDYHLLVPYALNNNQYKLAYNLIEYGAKLPVTTFINLVKENKSITINLCNLAIKKDAIIKKSDASFYGYSFYEDSNNLMDLVIDYNHYVLGASLIKRGTKISTITYAKLIKENNFEAGWLASIAFDEIKCIKSQKSFPEECGNNLIDLAAEHNQYSTLAYNLINKDVKVSPYVFAELINGGKPQQLFLAEQMLEQNVVSLNAFGYDFVNLAVEHKQYSLVNTLILKDARVSLDVLKKLIQHNNTLSVYLVELTLEKNKANMKALDYEFTDLIVEHKQYDLAQRLISKGVEFSPTAYETLVNLSLVDNATQILVGNTNEEHGEL